MDKKQKTQILLILGIIALIMFGGVQEKQSSIDLTDPIGSFNNASSEAQTLLIGLAAVLIVIVLIVTLIK